MLGDGSHGMRMRGIGFQLISRSISVGASALSSMSPSLNKAPVAPVRSSDHWLHEVVAGTLALARAGMTERKDGGAYWWCRHRCAGTDGTGSGTLNGAPLRKRRRSFTIGCSPSLA